MKRIHYILGMLALVAAGLAIFFVLGSGKTLVAHPQGFIAHGELRLIKTNILLMLSIVVPVFVLLFATIWKYRAKNAKQHEEPEHGGGALRELILWALPAVVVAVMIAVTWRATHALDPYKPIDSEVKPLKIQVVALDWKWLFIYPDLGIASVNFFQFPDRTPVQLSLSADGSPMNSFWLPQLSGQIYAMTGMVTPLHIMADGPGEYTGRAAEINGDGFADMTFIAKSSSQADFENWVAHVKQSPLHLTESIYNALLRRSINNPITLYSNVEEGLFDKIVMKPMQTPTAATVWKAPFSED